MARRFKKETGITSLEMRKFRMETRAPSKEGKNVKDGIKKSR